jgi:hypothetical protein
MLQQDGQCKVGVYTHVDGVNPIRFLLGGECSPFSPYRWLCTGGVIVGTRHSQRGPEKGQSSRKKFVGEHIWAKRCVNGRADSGSIYLSDVVTLHVPTPFTGRGDMAARTDRDSISDYLNKRNCESKVRAVDKKKL